MFSVVPVEVVRPLRQEYPAEEFKGIKSTTSFQKGSEGGGGGGGGGALLEKNNKGSIVLMKKSKED
jgi:hypothetical protein